MNPIANTIFKLKFQGQKIEVRVLDDGERINSRCIQRSFLSTEMLDRIGSLSKIKQIEYRNNILSSSNIVAKMKTMEWHPSSFVGERTSDHYHHHRIYLEVMSPSFTPVSDESSTNPQDKGMSTL